MALVKCGECGGLVSDKAVACPDCGAPVGSGLLGQKLEEAMEAKTAKLVRKDKPVGAGRLVQVIGLIVILSATVWFFSEPITGMFALVLGFIFGIVMVCAGSVMSVKYRCSQCSTKVEKSAKECPGCRRRFV